MLRICNITKSYDQHTVIKQISFTLEHKSCTLLTGGCGSGKSVLMRILSQLEEADQGELWFDNAQVSSKMPRIATLLMQDATSQLLGQTVLEDLYLWPIMAGQSHHEAKDLVEQTMYMFDLWPLKDQHTATLSGGQMRLVLLAGIFMQNTPIILLDEPFANLDYKSVIQVRKAIEQLLHLGKTLLIATHEIEKILSLSHRIIIMKEGVIAYDHTIPFPKNLDWASLNLKNPYDHTW